MWLENAPAHWEVRRLRTVLRRVTEHNRPELPLLSVVRKKGVILRNLTDQSDNHNFVPDDLSHHKVVRKGQFAINKMKAWQGSYGVSQWDGIVSPAYHVYAVEGVAGRYLHVAIRSRAYVPSFSAASDGVRIAQWDLSASRMRDIPFLIPPRLEQDAIVRFLDHADRHIRRYIRAKERLIELLEEQKQAIIHQAVTGQIDVRTGQPHPVYKDCGVEWLREVPDHWQRRAVGQLFLIGRGKVTSHEYITDHPGPFPLYSSQTENNGVMGYIDTFMFDGDYLTWTTDGAHAGTVFQRTGRFSCTNVCGTLFPKTQMSLHFMCMAVGAETKRYVRLDINPKLMNDTMSRIRISVPPLGEQHAIAEYVQGVREPTDLMIGRANRQINLLSEFRTRLIADVVTGKLDVREAAAILPDVDPLADNLNETRRAIAEPESAILQAHP